MTYRPTKNPFITLPAKMSYQKIYVPSKWLLNFDKYGYEGHVDIK